MNIERENEQRMGGKLEIPDNYFVYKVDLDHAEPYCTILPTGEDKEIKLPIPKSLAYYLRTHFCGSDSYHKNVQDDAVRALQNKIKELLNI